jgi:hypothetical protein
VSDQNYNSVRFGYVEEKTRKNGLSVRRAWDVFWAAFQAIFDVMALQEQRGENHFSINEMSLREHPIALSFGNKSETLRKLGLAEEYFTRTASSLCHISRVSKSHRVSVIRDPFDHSATLFSRTALL